MDSNVNESILMKSPVIRTNMSILEKELGGLFYKRKNVIMGMLLEAERIGEVLYEARVEHSQKITKKEQEANNFDKEKREDIKQNVMSRHKQKEINMQKTLELYQKGYAKSAIAKELNIANSTVTDYIYRLKLQGKIKEGIKYEKC